MKTVFECGFGVEAHLVSNLLQDAGIENQVLGEYLQGAAGELPVGRLVRVVVADEAADAARALIAEWDKAAPPQLPVTALLEPSPDSSRSGVWVWLLTGAFLMAALVIAYVVPLH